MSRLQEVSRLKQILDATSKRIEAIDSDTVGLRSDFTKYLCILVSAYIETAVAKTIQEYARRNGSPALHRFVRARTDRFTNARPGKIVDLLGSFDKGWGREMEAFLTEDKRKEAINSVVKNRNEIAHGRNCEITYTQVRDYYKKVQAVVDKVQELCLGNHEAQRS